MREISRKNKRANSRRFYEACKLAVVNEETVGALVLDTRATSRFTIIT